MRDTSLAHCTIMSRRADFPSTGRPPPGPRRQLLSSRWTGFYKTAFPTVTSVGGYSLYR